MVAFGRLSKSTVGDAPCVYPQQRCIGNDFSLSKRVYISVDDNIDN